MKWGDLTPLFTAILGLVMIVGTFVLLVLKIEIPDVVKTADGLIVASYFVSVGARGGSPPPPTGQVEGKL